jgi:hypothetical protein
MERFLYNPVRLAIIDPLGKKVLSSHCVLGNVPNIVYNACINGDKKVLEDYYGADFANKLAAPMLTESMVKLGGVSVTSGLSRKLNSIKRANETVSEDITLDSIVARLEAPKVSGDIIDAYNLAEVSKPQTGHNFNKDVAFFPDDNITNLREKVQCITNIPMYRQHIFYFNESVQIVPYKIFTGNGLFLPNILAANFSSTLFGLPVGLSDDLIGNEIRVETNEQFTLLSDINQLTFFIVDIMQLLGNAMPQLMVADQYQLRMVYERFIIIYWPQFTQESFEDFVRNGPEFALKYPDLHTPTETLKARTDAANKICNGAHQLQPGGLLTTITRSVILIRAKDGAETTVNLFNLFNWLAVGNFILEIRFRAFINSKFYLFRKCRNELDLEFPSYHNNCVIIAFSSDIGIAYMMIVPNGNVRVFLEQTPEESAISFDTMHKYMNVPNQIIAQINEFGSKVLGTGAKLQTFPEGSTPECESIDIIVKWPKVMPNIAYKYVITALSEYAKAGLLTIKESTDTETLVIFHRGIYDFDYSNINNILTASGKTIINNFYSYLSNRNVKQKWVQNYSGRLIAISHTSLCVKFIVSDIKEREFNDSVIKYLAYFTESLMKDPKFANVLTGQTTITSQNRLKKLKEFDPELFDLKKSGSKRVYSVVCQSIRQPIVYAPEEIATLSKSMQASLIKYWNFTSSSPAYYSCPTSKYPQLNFIAGVHPKGFCLPCCTKQKGERNANTYDECLIHRTIKVKDKHQISNTLIDYGKFTSVAKYMRLPPKLNLLTVALPKIYCIANVISHKMGENMAELMAKLHSISVQEYIQKIIEYINEMRVFESIYGGVLQEYYTNSESFVEDFTRVASGRPPLALDKLWNEILIELSELAFGFLAITIEDSSGDGNSLKIKLSNVALNGIAVAQMMSQSAKSKSAMYVLLMKIGDIYGAIILGELASGNRITTSHMVKFPDTGQIREIMDFLRSNVEVNRLPITLTEIGGNWKVTRKWMGQGNTLYAVSVSDAEGHNVYVPLGEAILTTNDGIPLDYEGFSEKLLKEYKAKYALQFIEEINKGRAEKIEVISKMTVEGKALGLHANVGLFYCTFGISEAKTVPQTALSYNPIIINHHLLRGIPPAADPLDDISRILYEKDIYKLIVLEIADYLSNERDQDIRQKLVEIIEKANLRTDLAGVQSAIGKLVNELDFGTIQTKFVNYYFRHLSKPKLIADILSASFEFDHVTANKLIKLDRRDLLAELGEIAKKVTVVGKLPDMPFPKSFSSCGKIGEKGQFHCSQTGKLILSPKVNLGEYLEILAADIANDISGKYVIDGLWIHSLCAKLASGDFIRRQGEHIKIYTFAK